MCWENKQLLAGVKRGQSRQLSGAGRESKGKSQCEYKSCAREVVKSIHNCTIKFIKIYKCILNLYHVSVADAN